jgi:hypothetical protein
LGEENNAPVRKQAVEDDPSVALDVEIELDEILEEETALAEEWSQLDAEATLRPEDLEEKQADESGEEDDDFHIEIAFDDLDDELDSEGSAASGKKTQDS